MLLLEAHGKQLLRDAGIAVPDSELVRDPAQIGLPGFPGPYMVKAQVPVGGRGKAGGIVKVDDASRLPAAVAQVLATPIKGYRSKAVLVESAVGGAEHYLALMVDAGIGKLRLLHSPRGGIEIEGNFAETPGALSLAVPPTPAGSADALARLGDRLSGGDREAVVAVASRLFDCFLRNGLMLAEINPLFVDGGAGRAGDAKIVVDMNAVPERPALLRIFEDNRDLYPDAWRKLSEGFDYVEIDRAGQIGLVTTGAGLSMMLIDELVAAGGRPINFCDMRTGQMRGKPDRLLRIFDWLQEAGHLRVVLVNVFAGITDLGEFAELLLEARRQRPGLRVPFVARLVGNGAERARKLIGEAACGIELEPDLERAIARSVALARGV
ncbi:MAG: ATP-grasp domain-containing protein [Pseudorhodoplanes sp.]